jgi:hypothetical protein
VKAARAAAAGATAGWIAFGALLAPRTAMQPREGAAGELFELYDLAGFARGAPAVVAGPDLPGRSRRIEPGDVLVARALAPPRRAWVAGESAQRTPVASDEWLVLRSGAYEPAYLRQLLVSNAFHLRFTQAFAGAAQASGRSARLRAIRLPAPTRARQQAIARVLDLADALRLRRRRTLAALDALAAALRGTDDAAALAACERLRPAMHASRRQLEALLSVLRDRAFRDEL